MAFEDTTVETDDMPEAPIEGGEIDDTIDAELLDGVAKIGDVIPTGVYLFQLDSWGAVAYGKDDAGNPNMNEPFISLTFKGRDEKVLGRTLRVMCPLVSREMAVLAASGNVAAQSKLKERLETQKSIMEAIKYQPKGSYSFIKDVLPLKPELKIDVMDYTTKGTKQRMNIVRKYLPANRPSFEG